MSCHVFIKVYQERNVVNLQTGKLNKKTAGQLNVHIKPYKKKPNTHTNKDLTKRNQNKSPSITSFIMRQVDVCA